MAKKEKRKEALVTESQGLGISGFTIGVMSIILAGWLGVFTGIVGFIFCRIQQKRNPTKLARIGIILNIWLPGIIAWLLAFIFAHTINFLFNAQLWVVTENGVYSRDIPEISGGNKDLLFERNNVGAFDGYPTILDVQRMAIEYAEVSPEKIKRWRTGAKWKAIMPRLSVNFSQSNDDNIEIYKNSSTSYVVRGPRETDNNWSVGLIWDLADVIWNPSQTSIDVRSKLMVQLRPLTVHI